MRTLIISAIEGMKRSEHMRPILKKEHLQICIVFEEESWYLLFDGKAPRFISREKELSDVVIEGDRDGLTQLFRGEDFLLAMKRRGDISVTGSLKHLLWLESLFYLTDVDYEKITDFVDKDNR